MVSMADPDIRLQVTTSCGGSKHSARGRGNLSRCPVSHVYIFVEGRPKSITKLDGVPWPDLTLPGSATAWSTLSTLLKRRICLSMISSD